MDQKKSSNPSLERKLGPIMLWGLGVGYVISGMYFGWNLGLAEGGTLGMAVATGFVIIMYLAFTFSYTEMACAIPKAGGAFDYAHQALGKNWGFFAGMAQNIEFIFAPPAIAFAIGAYLNLFLPSIPILVIAIAAYIIFTLINIIGVQTAATFELAVTILAVIGLILFFFSTAPSFEYAKVTQDHLPNGWKGAFAALPFAIWFFLAIEGVANVAEETINPQRNILIGFGSAIGTLVVLCLFTFAFSVGVDGWQAIVYDADGNLSDSPLPLALEKVLGADSINFKLVSFIGLFGLIASFHGIILAAGRSTYEFGKVRFAPQLLGKVNSKYKTPVNALIFNTCVGIVALFTGKTGEIITIACFGALSLYIVSMVSVIVLRKTQPDLHRPFKVPFYPVAPIVALVIAVIAMIAIVINNLGLAAIYLLILLVSFLWFRITYKADEN